MEAVREVADKREQKLVELVKQIYLSIRNNATYPGNHPITTDLISRSFHGLSEFLDQKETLTVSVFRNKLFIEDTAINGDFNFSSQFANDLSKRSIDSITFYRGVALSEFMSFINMMVDTPDTLTQKGGVAAVFEQGGFASIKFNTVKYGKLSKDSQHPSDNNLSPDFTAGDGNDKNAGKQIVIEEQGELKRKDKVLNLVFPGHRKKTSRREEIEKLLTAEDHEGAQQILQDIYKEIADPSSKVRKQALESFSEIYDVLERFNYLEKNFKDIAHALTNVLERDRNIDVYLAANQNLEKVCSSQEENARFIIEETVGYRLYQANNLSKSHLKQALKARRQSGKSLQYHLAEMELVDESSLVESLAKQYGNCETVTLSNIDSIPVGVLKAFPTKFIRKYRVLPYKFQSGSLMTATNNPNDLSALNDLHFISGYSVKPALATEYHLLKAIKDYFHIDLEEKHSPDGMGDEKGEEEFEFIENERELDEPEELNDSAAPVIRLVNLILKDAISRNASDIHIEPFEKELRIRYRIDGTLATVLNPSFRFSRVISSRIKVMSKLDISENRRPQDGRFRVKKDKDFVDFRVSVFPGMFGEKVVLRLLNKGNTQLGVDKIGLNDDEFSLLSTTMHKSKGMILVTGPTGSGKTTTLYSILNDLNDGSKNISTVEDPIEYHLKGINQFQMNTRIGLDFPDALRNLLRQDPDIIMVGEMRDKVTASIATKAALTGHLVLSTLHTNSAPETIVRLIDMGTEPFMINSCVNLIVAQRLMRKLCPKCKTECEATDLQLRLLDDHNLDIADYPLFKGEGCEECNHTGYKGRLAVFEMMRLSGEIREIISKGEWSSVGKEDLKRLGIINLQENGFKKIIEGLTTLEEWARVVT